MIADKGVDFQFKWFRPALTRAGFYYRYLKKAAHITHSFAQYFGLVADQGDHT